MEKRNPGRRKTEELLMRPVRGEVRWKCDEQPPAGIHVLHERREHLPFAVKVLEDIVKHNQVILCSLIGEVTFVQIAQGEFNLPLAPEHFSQSNAVGLDVKPPAGCSSVI